MGIIRLLLAVAVFNSHFQTLDLPVVGGHEAVLAFFAISGFYMALLLDQAYVSPSRFYASRFLSLYPPYLFALGLAVALYVSLDVHPVSSLDNLQRVMADPLGFLAMSWTSLCVVGQELLFTLVQWPDGSIHFSAHSRQAIWAHAPLIQAWSLSLEIIFYALAPWLAKRGIRTMLCLVAASLLIKLTILVTPLHDIVFFKRFFPAEFWLFGCGMLTYRLHKQLPAGSYAVDGSCLALLVLCILLAETVPEVLTPFALPLAILMTMPFIFRTFGRFEFDRLLGKISYPFYLLHFTLIGLFETYAESPEGWHIMALSMGAAILIHCLFAPGMESIKRRLRSIRPIPIPEPLAPAIIAEPTPYNFSYKR